MNPAERLEAVRSFAGLGLVAEDVPPDWAEQVLEEMGDDGDVEDAEAVIEALNILGFHQIDDEFR